MSIIFATNNIADVGGNPLKDTTSGRFRSSHVGYGIACTGDASTTINTAEFTHAAVGGSVTWIHVKIWHSRDMGSNNGVGSFWCNIRDASDTIIMDFDLATTQDVHMTLFGSTTVNHTPAGNNNPFSSIESITDVDIKLTVTPATIACDVYIDQKAGPYFSASVANNGKTAPVKETWRCHDWADSGLVVTQTLSEYIVADEDTRGLSLTDKFTLAAGANDDWTGDVADLFDESILTGMTADALNLRQSQEVTAYTGPNASLVRALAITVFGDKAGPDGDIRGWAAVNPGDNFFTGKAQLQNAVASARAVAFDTNPVDSSAWLETDFVGFNLGITSA